MLNVYVVYAYQDVLSQVDPIKSVNPDKIICWCVEEYDAATIVFKKLIRALMPWLIKNNKSIDIIYPGPDKKFNDNVFLHNSFGYYLNNQNMTLLKTQAMNFDDVHLNANKLYTLYCNRGSSERLTIIDTMVRENLLEHGIVTFRGGYYLSPEERPWKYHDGSPLTDEEDVTAGLFTETYDPCDFPKSFLNGFMDVVCESRVKSNEFFTTEKTAKSIIALKPFLVLSSQHYHNHLMQEYGIEPYTEIFDYSFDSCADINERIEGIVANVKSLLNKDKNTIHELIFDKLVYNKKKFTEYGDNYDKMVPKALEFATTTQFKLHGADFVMEAWLHHLTSKGWIKQ